MPILEIVNFCNIEKKTINIDETGIILLNGDSGSGKTTIFNALTFVFYDHMGTSCYSKSYENVKPISVKLTYSNGDIFYRQKRKDVFIITYDNRTYQGEQAQELIQRLYGSMNLFLSSCYLMQDDKWFFLNLKNNEKLAVLQEIAESDPLVYERLYSKCNDKITEITNKISNLQIQLKLKYELYNDNFSRLSNLNSMILWSDENIKSYISYFQIPIDCPFELFKDYIDNIWKPKKIQDYNHRLSILEHERDRYVKEKNEQEYIESQISKLKIKISNIDIQKLNSKESLILKSNELANSISFIKENQKKKQIVCTINQLKEELDLIPNVDTPIYSSFELNNFEQILNWPIDKYREDLEKINKYYSDLESFEKDQNFHKEQLKLLTDKYIFPNINDLKKEYQNKIIFLDTEYKISLEDIEKNIYLKIVEQKQKQEEILNLEPLRNLIFQLTNQYNQKLTSFNKKKDTLNQEILNLQYELNSITVSISNLKEKLIKSDDYKNSVLSEIELLNKEKFLFELNKNKYECPKCKTYLFFEKNKLTILPHSEFSECELNDKLEKLTLHENNHKSRILELNRLEQLSIQKDHIEKQLNIKIKNLEEIEKTDPRLNSKVNDELAQIEDNKSKYNSKKSSLEEKINEIQNQILDDQKKILDLKKNYNISIEILKNEEKKELSDFYNILRTKQSEFEIEKNNLVVPVEPVKPLNISSFELQSRRESILKYIEQYNSLPISSDQLEMYKNEYRNYQKIISLKEQIQNYEKQLKDITTEYLNISEIDQNVTLDNLEANLLTCQNEIREINENKITYDVLLNELNEYEKLKKDLKEFDFTQICQIKDKISNLHSWIATWMDEYSQQVLLRKLFKIKEEYDNIEKEIYDCNQKFQQFSKIKNVIHTSEYFLIDSVLSKINKKVNKILTNIFTEPINVELRAVRQLKTENRLKPEINIIVNYNGIVFNNLNLLSGGQKHRIYMAFILAFFKMKKFPFLLLDECIYSVSLHIKRHVISLLSDKFNNASSNKKRLILIVLHDTDLDPYSQIITL